ncbi:MAG: hypothetical protein RLZZ502_1818 [Pseudomonadota bacterium]|jgi:3-methylfumaryl-CoA hydratase
MSIEHYQTWIGKTETTQDISSSTPVKLLAATLNRDFADFCPDEALPPLTHWLHFLPQAPLSQVGADGHPARGGFLPPITLPRRMWAGSDIIFHAPIPFAQAIERRSTIIDVTQKQGSSGTLIFVKVLHEIFCADVLCVSDTHHIVYREINTVPAHAAAAKAAPKEGGDFANEVFRQHIRPDPVLLFRYSALTFNSHKIHYDQPYVTQTEGYPGLVVHGPLIATLLLDLLRQQHPERQIKSFDFRALSPLFDLHPFEVCGKLVDHTATLWARNHQGALAMQAKAQLHA